MKPNPALKAILHQAVALQAQISAMQAALDGMVQLAASALEVRETLAPAANALAALAPEGGAEPEGKKICEHLHRTNIETMGETVQMCDDCYEMIE